MSRTRNYHDDSLAVQKRYFDVVEILNRENRLLGGMSGFLDMSGIDKRNWRTQKCDIGRGYFQVSWLVPLVKYYNVSAKWLLTGEGKMFKRI